MSGKLDARQVAWISPSATKLDTPSVKLKISQKWWMSSEQRIQLRIPTIHGKLFPYYIYISVEQNKSSNEEIWVSDPKVPRSQVLGSWSHFYTMPAYNMCKLELGNYDKKGEGAKIRSKCEWYQHTWRKADKVLLEFWKTKSYKYSSKSLNYWPQRHYWP